MRYRQYLDRHRTEFTLEPIGAVDMFEKVRARRKRERRFKQLKAAPFCMDCIRRDSKHILAVDVVLDARGERLSVCGSCYEARTGG